MFTIIPLRLLLLALLMAFHLSSGTLRHSHRGLQHHRPFESMADLESLGSAFQKKSGQQSVVTNFLDDTDSNAGCTSMEAEIQVSKDEKDVNGEVIRVCEGVVKVTKCEGVCLSRLRPWINSPSGFVKECKCCREGSMSQKSVTLEICFDAEGNRLNGQTMEVTISQPKECSCFKCA